MSVDASTVFAAMSHPMRLRALILLNQVGECCVCELTQTLELAQPLISRHLTQLKQAGLVQSRRQGLWMYYTLHTELPAWVKQIIDHTTQGVASTSPYEDDLMAFNTLADRPNQTCCS